MIDIFEQFAPSYSRIVRKFALDVWYDRADLESFLKHAAFFKKRYELELMEMFRRRKLSFTPSRIRELSDRWLADQIMTGRRIEEISVGKKKKLIQEAREVEQGLVERISEFSELPKTPEKGLARVLPDTSFSENFARRALQIGEEEAFALGRDLNHFVVSSNSDVYEWMTQNDSRVRETHRLLAKKKFSYNSPPTTIDKYGHKHTGNPGTDWGCRCWEKAVIGKPLIGYIAEARRIKT